MFHWNAAIYLDEKVKKKPGRYRKMLEQKKLVKNCYCITLPVNEENCLDIYSSRELWFSYYREKTIEIVGLAADKEGAENLVCRIISDVAGRYGQVDAKCVREYFQTAQTMQ
ncbi:MAG: hypothetical protein SO170_08325 [Butyribacter sp.]|nr:hypothetical protein [bacterium]MDY3854941.1 hypothetical protein [Butyribacter sp.]